MTGYANAARIAAVIALFALPPLLLTDDAAAADRRYGDTKPRSSATDPQSVFVLPQTKQEQKEVARGLFAGLKRTNPMEYKECLSRHR